MAHFKKTPTGWQAQIQIGKRRASKIFPTKGRAQQWAQEQSIELRKVRDLGIDSRGSLSDLLARYSRDVSPKKRGERWEVIRLKAIGSHELFVGKKVGQIDVPLLSKYRDARLADVSDATVRRELNLLSSVFQVAMTEWKMMATNPVKAMTKPKDSPHREVIISDEDVKLLLEAIPYNPKKKAQTLSQCAGLVFLFAMATGMRMSEICGLTKKDINGRVAKLKITKNGKPREIPLSLEAMRLISLLPDQDPIFGLKPSQVDALFRKARDKAALEINFHDSRHTFATRTAEAKRIDPLSLAKILGHSDLRMTLKYFHPTAQSLAHLLD